MLLSLYLTALPKVIQHPEHQSIAAGMDANFHIATIGENLQFQWQKDGCDLSNSEKYHGINSKILHIVKVEECDEGHYRCLVKNDDQEKFSAEALLTVLDSKLVNAHYVLLELKSIIIHCPPCACCKAIAHSRLDKTSIFCLGIPASHNCLLQAAKLSPSIYYHHV